MSFSAALLPSNIQFPSIGVHMSSMATESGTLRNIKIARLLLGVLVLGTAAYLSEACFQDNFYISWGSQNVQLLNNGNEVHVSLGNNGGCGFNSLHSYLYGSFSANIKLIPNNSAGTITSFYLTSSTQNHDEIDFEFLGNLSGQPYLVQTNVYSNGTDGREQRINLWFDPTTSFHTYNIVWNHQQIIWFVDSIPVRIFKNVQSATGVVYPSMQPMTLQVSIFDGSSWATRGGKVPVNYTASPFTAAYNQFDIEACQVQRNGNYTACATSYDCYWWESAAFASVNATQLQQLAYIRQNYQNYDYCSDSIRYPIAPPECWYNHV